MKIDFTKDKLLTDFSLKTLEDRYMVGDEKSPQEAFARAARAFADDDDHAQRLYDYASNLWFMFSTPVLSNGGTERGMPISCFLNYVEDSREGITEHYTENAYLSSFGGGIGGSWSAVRSQGTRTSKGSESTGAIPFMKVVDAEMLAFSQGVTRRGSYAGYLHITHPEIEEFLDIRKATGGDINRKCTNLHHGIVINDKFMETIHRATKEENFDDSWELIDPHTQEVKKVVSARTLWVKLLQNRMETGEPYLMFEDAVNQDLPNHNLDVILVEAGKIGWGASSRNAGFNCLPPSKMSFKKMQSIYGNEETKKFYKNSVEGSNYTKDIIKEYNIDCDVTGNSNYVVAHHPNKFEQIKEQARAYKDEFEIETEVYSKEEFNQIGHGGTEQYGAFSYKPGFAINPLKFVNGIAKYALSKKLKIFEHTKVDQINKDNGSYLLKTKEGSIRSKKIVVATNGFYQEGLIPKMDGRVLPVISNIIVTRKLNDDELNLHNFKTFSPIANTKNLLYYYRKLPDNRILFGTRGDLSGSDQSNLDMSKKMEKFLKDIFPKWSNINIEYNWRGLIALSQKLTPSIGKIDNEEIYYGFGYNGVGVSAAPWTGKQLSKLVFSSNSKDLDISKIYKGLPKKFIFPKLRLFYFRLAVLFYNIKDKFNI